MRPRRWAFKAWGADAVRDSDGTAMPRELQVLDADVYSTHVYRARRSGVARVASDQVHRKFLMCDPVTAVSDSLEIGLLAGFHPEKYAVDAFNDPAVYWQVYDRTTGQCWTLPLAL